MAINVLDFASGFFKNWQVDNSVAGGAGVTALVMLVGAVAVTLGVSIPPIAIAGVVITTTATPLTMTLVTALAACLGHVATAILPVSVNQSLAAAATKLNVSVDHLKSFVPQIQASYPNPAPQDTGTATPNNLNKP